MTKLWSASLLHGDRNLVRAMAVAWQATLQGFQSRGVSREQSEALLRRSVQIAQEARAIFLEGRSKGPYAGRENKDDGSAERRRPVLVAASVGSYGAYLADGSEYTYKTDRSFPSARDCATLLCLIDVSMCM